MLALGFALALASAFVFAGSRADAVGLACREVRRVRPCDLCDQRDHRGRPRVVRELASRGGRADRLERDRVAHPDQHPGARQRAEAHRRRCGGELPSARQLEYDRDDVDSRLLSSSSSSGRRCSWRPDAGGRTAPTRSPVTLLRHPPCPDPPEPGSDPSHGRTGQGVPARSGDAAASVAPTPAPSDNARGQTPAVARRALSPRAYPSPR